MRHERIFTNDITVAIEKCPWGKSFIFFPAGYCHDDCYDVYESLKDLFAQINYTSTIFFPKN